jgi:anti-sigma factor RsiW
VAGTPITCREILDLLTDYLESALPAPVHLRVEGHLAEFDHCADLLDQLRATIRAVGALAEESVAPDVRERLVVAFRSWRHDDS